MSGNNFTTLSTLKVHDVVHEVGLPPDTALIVLEAPLRMNKKIFYFYFQANFLSFFFLVLRKRTSSYNTAEPKH